MHAEVFREYDPLKVASYHLDPRFNRKDRLRNATSRLEERKIKKRKETKM